MAELSWEEAVMGEALDRKTLTLWCSSDANITLTRAELRVFLLKTDGWIMRDGRLCDIKSRHLGAGVYRVTAEPRP